MDDDSQDLRDDISQKPDSKDEAIEDLPVTKDEGDGVRGGDWLMTPAGNRSK